MHTMDHHLSNGDAAAVELRSSMVGDPRVPETRYDIPAADIPAAKQLPFNVVHCSGQVIRYSPTLVYSSHSRIYYLKRFHVPFH